LPKLPILDDSDANNDSHDPSASDTIASMWLAQVEAYDALPRERWKKNVYTFSPSRADSCLRELYYDMNGDPTDDEPLVPWQTRRARNGNAYHAETQRHHTKMADELRRRELGHLVNYEVVATEIDGFASFTVELGGKKRVVRIKGRADVILRYVGESIPGVIATGEYVVVDYKSKDRMKGVDGVKRRGVPSYTVAQMTAYSLLRFESKDGAVVVERPKRAIVHYESLQKPDKNDVVESKDVHVVVVESSESDGHAIVRRFAKVVEAVEDAEVGTTERKETIPAPELDKCMFCAYKRQCAKDGGYQAKEGA
jgi:CRISPR/Cas system-associated exonuclease Cas4 (RecB family)